MKSEGRAPLACLDEWVRTWTARADSSQVDPRAVLAVWRDALDATVVAPAGVPPQEAHTTAPDNVRPLRRAGRVS